MTTRHDPRPVSALALLCTFALATSGCNSPNVAPSPGRPDPYPAPYHDPEITVLDADLAPWLAFQPASIVADENTPMQVSVDCRNLTDKNYAIDYRFTFFNRRGQEVRPVMSWTQKVLQERQLVQLTAGAMSTEAVRYRLEVRWSQQ